MDLTNLPHDISSFLGRDTELADIARAIDVNRLVTLSGAGGVGKTRLALKVAESRVGSHRDGVWLVELASVSHGASVPDAVARVLDLREEASISLIDTLTREVAGREMLLIFDNCEHVLEACAALIETLLKSAPGLRVLATSREPLGIRGEVSRSLQPLDGAEGAALFTERAQH